MRIFNRLPRGLRPLWILIDLHPYRAAVLLVGVGVLIALVLTLVRQ